MRKVLLLWLLPVVDMACGRRISTYYAASMGIRVPGVMRGAGMLERLLVYLPTGFAFSHFLGWFSAVLVFAVIVLVSEPIEIYMMRRGMFPWRFLRGVTREVVTSFSILEAYNCTGYFLIGVALGVLL